MQLKVRLPMNTSVVKRLLITVTVVLVLTSVSLFMPVGRVSIEGVGTLSFDTSVTLSVGQQAAYASPDWLSGWTYRRAISLSPVTPVADYQVLVTLTTSIMGNPYANVKSDGSDIRFTGADKTTLQDYWIESWNNTGTSKIWVEVKTSGTSTIYMYYGNSSASSASNGDATFDFFDDFSSGLSKWNVHIDTDVAITTSYGNPAPCLEISGGFTSSPYGFAAIGSDATYNGFQNGIIEADIYPTTVALPEIIFRGNYSTNTGYKGRWDCRTGTESPWMKPPYSGWGAFGSGVPRFGLADQWQRAKLIINGSTFQIYSNDNLKSTVTNTDYPGPGEIGLANHYGAYARFDNIRIRKYASPEPSATVGSEEQFQLDISNTPSSKPFGLVAENSPYWSNGGGSPTWPLDDGECYFTVTNQSSGAVNISIRAINFSGGVGWTLASSPGENIVTLKAGKSGDVTEADMVILTTSDQSFISNLGTGNGKKWEIKLETGTFTDGAEKSSTITLTASAT
jgi:hypothetical protein